MVGELRWVTTDEMTKLVRTEISTAVQELVPLMVDQLRNKEFVTNKEASGITGRSVRQLDHLRKTGQIDFYMNGNRVLFKYTDLIDWIKAGHVVATKPRHAA